MSWTPDRVADELLSAGRLFRLPQGGPPAFVTAEEYLSGDVREKLRVAERWTNLSPAFARNVEALRAALPAPVPREDVAVGLGAGFVPPEVVEEFAYHLLPTMYRGGVKAVYVVATATWILDWCGGAVVKTSHHNLSTWGTTRVDAMSLLEHALRNESPVVYDTDPRTEERVRNAKATAEAQAKLADLRAEWDRWWRATTSSVLFPSGELRKVGDVLHEAYEAEFNRYSPRRYDGRHLRFPGLAATLPGTDAAFAPRRHQLDGALRILERNVPDDTFLLGYDVGLGKTLAAILGVRKRLETGVSRRACFVVPKHVLGQWRDAWQHFFPDLVGRVVVASDDDFTPQRRQDFLARCVAHDASVLVMTIEQFGTIPTTPEVYEAYLARELDEVSAELAERGERDADGRHLKRELKRREAALQKHADRYRARWAKLKLRADAPASWQDLGVDVLVLDEFHYFKNDAVPTRMQNVAGLPRGESQRAFDARMKIHWLAAPELFGEVGLAAAPRLYGRRGCRQGVDGYPASGKVGGLSATWVTNSLAEVWVVMRQLQPRLLRERGLWSFDAFAAVFTKPFVSVEMDVVGKFRLQTRLAFQNIPELQAMLSLCVDRAQDVPEVARPALATGRMQVAECEGSPELVEYVLNLAERAERVRKRLVDPEVDNMLKITHDGRVAALYNGPPTEAWPEHRRTKVDACADVVWSLYCSSDARRGVILVFCDLFTPKAPSGRDDEDAAAEAEAMTPEERFRALGVYGVLRDKLVRRGIRAAEVAFVHNATTTEERDALFADVRAGRVRVLVGSTQKLATGVNVQDRVYGMIHLTVPWRPDWIEQAEGRGLRDGNLFHAWGQAIHSVAIVTTRSYDVVSWQIIQIKAEFLRQIKRDRYGKRTAEDVGDLVLSAGMAKAIALGDVRVVEKAQLELELAAFQRSYGLHVEDERRRLAEVADLPGRVADAEADLAGARRVVAHLEANPAGAFAMSLRGVGLGDSEATVFVDRAEAAQRIRAVVDRLRGRARNEVHLGTYRGFSLALDLDQPIARVVVRLGDYEATEVALVADPVAALDAALADLREAVPRLAARAENLRRRLDASRVGAAWAQRGAALAALSRYEALCAELAQKDEGDDVVDRKPFNFEGGVSER